MTMVWDEPPKPGFPPGQAVGYQQCNALYFQHCLDKNLLIIDWVEPGMSWYNSSWTGQHQVLLGKVQRYRPSHGTRLLP